LIVESQHKKGDSELPTLPEVLYFTARDALELKSGLFWGVVNGLFPLARGSKERRAPLYQGTKGAARSTPTTDGQ